MGEPDQIVYMSDKPYHRAGRRGRRVSSIHGRSGLDRGQMDSGHRTDPAIARSCITSSSTSSPRRQRAFGRGGIWPATPRACPPQSCPPGTAAFVPADSKLVFQMHYTPNGTPQEDRSMIGLQVRRSEDGQEDASAARWCGERGLPDSRRRPAITR